jgi:hypothetical protein
MYNTLLAKLRSDIKSLNLKRHKLNKSQESMLNFIEGKKSSSQYILNGEIIQLTRGNEEFGFEHILLTHYQETSSGKLNAREILNLWTLIEKGSPTTDFEKKGKDKEGYRLFKEIKRQIKKEEKQKIREKFTIIKETNPDINIDIEVKKEINRIIEKETTNIRLLLINFREGQLKRVLTYYSDRRFEETGDLS